MKKKHNGIEQQILYNATVKQAYFKILKQAKRLLSAIEQAELRYTLEREERRGYIVGAIVHEIISPVLYLRLEYHGDNVMESILALNRSMNPDT